MRLLSWIAQNLLSILVLILIVLQFLTWRAIVSVREEVDDTRRAVIQTACGTEAYGQKLSPCEVVIRNRGPIEVSVAR
jgi:hypothetical protein